MTFDPRTKVMVVGPTEIEEDVRLVGARHMAYNRTHEFSEFVHRIEGKLRKIFRTQNDVYFLSCSGTGVMECALVNFLSPGDEVIVLSNGTFADRWVEIGRAYRLRCCHIRAPQGQQFDLADLSKALTPDVKAVFVTANETSTGTACDLKSIGQIVRSSPAILVVDAISSLVANQLETDAWNCDVVIASTQKALALPPGLGFISVSAKAWQHETLATLPKYYFDLRRYRTDLLRGQTPFTPAIGLLYQLDVRLDKILSEGLDNVVERHRVLSDYLRTQLQSLNLQTFDTNPADGMVGMLFDGDIDAFDVVARLKRDFQIEIAPSPEPDRKRIARVGLYGNLHRKDVDDLIDALRKIVKDLRTANRSGEGPRLSMNLTS